MSSPIPEDGTVSYVDNNDRTVQSKKDLKGVRAGFSYDACTGVRQTRRAYITGGLRARGGVGM